MVNLEHRLTVDDLIVEYAMYKVKNGYEPKYSTSEFIDFLHFFETKMEVDDILYDGEELFKRFFERKIDADWSSKNYRTGQITEKRPHMNMSYSEDNRDYIISANNKLSDYDKSVINTYFMDNGCSKYDDYKGTAWKIRNIIGEYLKDKPKRNIPQSGIELEEKEILAGKYIAAEIINHIWRSYIDIESDYHKYPKQCDDINKYLFEMDLPKIIGTDMDFSKGTGTSSIREKLLEVYSVFSSRIAILYHFDKELKVSSYKNPYLPRANYELLIQGYETLMSMVFGEYKKALEFDLSESTFKESHELDVVYDLDEDPDVKITTTSIENDKVKKLVRTIENNNNNK